MAMLRRGRPLSPARQRLAEAIAARAEGAARGAVLDGALERARAEGAALEAVVEQARDAAEHATAHAHDHAVARLIGAPKPPWPTPADAAAALAAAEGAAAELLEARRAILAERDALRAGDRARADRVAEAAEAAMREEMGAEGEALAGEIVSLQAQMIDKGRALFYLNSRHALALQAPNASPTASAAREAVIFPTVDSREWNRGDASPTERRFEAKFHELCKDAAAELGK